MYVYIYMCVYICIFAVVNPIINHPINQPLGVMLYNLYMLGMRYYILALPHYKYIYIYNYIYIFSYRHLEDVFFCKSWDFFLHACFARMSLP